MVVTVNNACYQTQGEVTDKKRHGVAWLNVALALLLFTLLSGVGATFCAVNDAQKHASNENYFDAKLVWDKNDGSVTGEGNESNRIVPSEERSVTLAAQNIGSEGMFPRVKFNYKWVACEKSADGTTYTKVKDINEADDEATSNGALFKSANIGLVLNTEMTDEKWVDGEDGYFYYDQGDDPVPAESTTGNLTASVEVSGDVGESYNDNKHHETSAEENRYVEYNTDGTEKAVYYTGVQVSAELEAVAEPYGEASDIAKTGDELMFSPLTLALFALTIFSLLACIFALIAGRKKRTEATSPQMFTEEG